MALLILSLIAQTMGQLTLKTSKTGQKFNPSLAEADYNNPD